MTRPALLEHACTTLAGPVTSQHGRWTPVGPVSNQLSLQDPGVSSNQAEQHAGPQWVQ